MDEQNVPINKFSAPVPPPALPSVTPKKPAPTPVPEITFPEPKQPTVPSVPVPPPPTQPNRPTIAVPIPPTPPSFIRPAAVPTAAPPVVPVSTPKPKPVPPAPPPKPIAIRTMQDDISAVQRGEFKKPAVPSTLPSVKPLPPRPKEAPAKTITSPAAHRSLFSLSKLLIGLSSLLVIAIIGGVGWYFWQKGTVTIPFLNTTSTPASALSVIPSTSLFVWHYHFSTPDSRVAVTTAWQRTGESKTPSLTGLLNGDPRLLSNEASVSDVYYIALADDPRLYVLVAQNEATKKLFEGSYDVTALKKNGWYILHGLATDQFEAALQKSSLETDQTAAGLDATDQQPVQAWFSAAGTNELRKSATGGIVTGGTLGGLFLQGKLSNDGTIIEATASAPPASIGDPNARVIAADLLPIIPSDVTAAVLGTNFHEEVAAWLKAAQFDAATLDKPSVAAFMSNLSGPYALYTRLGQDATPDAGLVIPLPPALQDAVRAGDPTIGPAIEQALPELIGLVTQSQPATPVSFSDGTYQEIPLRYANILGQTVALDYALTPTTLLIATSKEGMQALVDTAIGKRSPALSLAWQPSPAAHSLLVGNLTHPLLSQLLPSGGAGPWRATLVITPEDGVNRLTVHLSAPTPLPVGAP